MDEINRNQKQQQISKEILESNRNFNSNKTPQSSPIHSKDINHEKLVDIPSPIPTHQTDSFKKLDASQSSEYNNNNNNNNYIYSGSRSSKGQFNVTESLGYFSIETLSAFKLNSKRRYRILFYIFDWTLCILIGLIGALIFKYVSVRGRLFRLDDPEISYPLVPEIIPFTYLIVYSTIIPVSMISLVNLIFTRNLCDFHHSLLGLLQSISVSLLLVASFKSFIGGLRPNFLQICNPTAESIASANPVGYKGIYFSSEICTADNKDINDALSAYPSGHAAIGAAGLYFLFLYLHAKLKTFDNRGQLIVFVLVISCIISLLLIGISRIADYRHTFGNVCCGWILGISIATFMYRLNYKSVFGKDNHIPIIMPYERNNDNNNNNNI